MLDTAIDVAKIVGGLIVGTGVTAVVTNLIKVTTPKDVSKVTKTCILAGGVFISWVASQAASDQLDKRIDTVVKYTKIVVNKVKPQKKVKTEEEVYTPTIVPEVE